MLQYPLSRSYVKDVSQERPSDMDSRDLGSNVRSQYRLLNAVMHKKDKN